MLSDKFDEQRAILYNIAMIALKILMFYEILQVSIEGAYVVDRECFHLALQNLFYVMKKITYAHCWLPTKPDLQNPENHIDTVVTMIMV